MLVKNDLTNLMLKKTYDPSYDGSDVLNEFYIPCLSVSRKYDRCSAYFSSAVLKSFSKGLVQFFKNGGHARFIFSCQIEESEMNQITEAYRSKMDAMTLNLDDTIDNDYEVANLSYLIKKGLVEVKIAFMMKNKSALMHIKSGMFEDENNNHIYFDGSGNETEAGILLNAETFNVFDDFEGENFYVTNGIERFNKMWNNTYSPETIRTEYPIGKLFDKLVSYNKDRLFNSATEFYEYKNCILIDIDKSNQSIVLTDYTDSKRLRVPMIMKSQFGQNWMNVCENSYLIKKLNVHILKDIIIKRLELYKIDYVLSVECLIYLELNDLELDKRQKLGLSIKKNIEQDIWKDNYERFKYIVNNEMIARLKDQQMVNAFYHLCMKSSANFSVPGTGKTYISYGLFSYLQSINQKEKDVDHLVVFGPLNCFRAWIDESKNIFGTKHNFTIFNVTEHHGDFEKQLNKEKYDIYLINYDFINEKRLKIINESILNSKSLVIFDEIHKLKSITGTRANLFLKMFDECTDKPIYKLALTGTPLPNSYQDLYNYLKILYSSELEGLLSMLSLNRLKLADSNPIVSSTINDMLQPFFVRTTKKDLNVPIAEPDDLVSLSSVLTDDERQLFRIIWKKYDNPLLKIIRLIQASSNPKLLLKTIDKNELKKIFDDFDENQLPSFEPDNLVDEVKLINKIGLSSKTKKTIDKIKEIVNSGNKVIVWCLFIDTIDLIKNELGKDYIKSVAVSGRDSIVERDNKIDLFKNSDVNVLITNPNTLAESISLHKVCHSAIYLEFGFNLTYLLQSKDRIHRVGLTNYDKTNYYFAISKKFDIRGPIDEDIYERLTIKDKRMKRVVESNDLCFIPNNDDIKDMIAIIEKL